jgi:hypothetical protein
MKLSPIISTVISVFSFSAVVLNNFVGAQQGVVCISDIGDNKDCGKTELTVIEEEVEEVLNEVARNRRNLQSGSAACQRTPKPPFCLVIPGRRRRILIDVNSTEEDSEIEDTTVRNLRRSRGRERCENMIENAERKLKELADDDTMPEECQDQLEDAICSCIT